MRRWPNGGLLLAHRLRRWPTSEPMLANASSLQGMTNLLTQQT